VRYHVLLGADTTAEREVDLVDLPNGALEAHIDGRKTELDIVSVGKQFSVRVGAHVFDLTMLGTLPELDLTASGYRSRVRVESERMRSAGRLGAGAGSHAEKVIKSPMPGRVVKVLVAKGDAVKAGQGLVVLEAMKMENEVRARAPGTVAAVHVTAGAAVEGSAVLVTLT
jgi:biotin carboxyl carrier protein